MAKTSIGIAMITIAALVAFILALSGPVSAKPKVGDSSPNAKACGDKFTNCLNSCRGPFGPGRNQNQCTAQCELAYVNCTDPEGQPHGIAPGNTSGTPPQKWQPPVNVGVNPPVEGGGTSPPKVPIGVHPINPINPVGVNPPVGDGGTKAPKPPIGVGPINPINPVGVAPPSSGTGSGVTILEKSGTVKPPEVTTSPIGITTTKVYDEKGNWAAKLTDPTGKVLETITTTLDPKGGSKTTTTNAEGKVLNTTVTKSDGTSILYNGAGKIVSQSKMTGTGGTYGKGHKESFVGQTWQKHKEKGINEFFHEQKQNVKEQNWGSTAGSNSSGPAIHHRGKH